MFKKMHQIANEDTKGYWKNWSAYRNSLQELIDKIIKEGGLRTDSILILGAGNGNDVPIYFLEENYQQIVIADIDESAMERFLGRVCDPAKFSSLQLDLSGIAREIGDQNIYKLPDGEKIKYIRHLEPNPDFSHIIGNFDLVLNCNYSTQLVAPYFLWREDIHKESNADLYLEVSMLTERIQKRIFDQIFNLLKPSGRLIHCTDIVKAREHNTGHTVDNQSSLICGSNLPSVSDSKFLLERVETFNWDFSNAAARGTEYLVKVYILQKR